jgi:hypothetical protein
MISFLTENLGTTAVGLLVGGIVTKIIANMISDKRSGKSPLGCDCGCVNCTNLQLHSTKEDSI